MFLIFLVSIVNVIFWPVVILLPTLSTQRVQMLCYGFDQTHWYVRLDVDRSALAELRNWRIQLEVPDRRARIPIRRETAGGVSAVVDGKPVQELVCAYRQILELAVPKTLFLTDPSETFQLHLTLYDDAQPLERYPSQGVFRILIPPSDLDAESWSV